MGKDKSKIKVGGRKFGGKTVTVTGGDGEVTVAGRRIVRDGEDAYGGNTIHVSGNATVHVTDGDLEL